MASLEMLSIHLGRRLGLYGGVAAPGGVTPDELATVAGIAPRYAVEWLEQQAVAGFVTVDDPDAAASARRFRLSDEQRAAFVEPEDPAHVAPVADMVAGIGSVLDDLAEAYRRGTGVPYDPVRPTPAQRPGQHQPAHLPHVPAGLARRHRSREADRDAGPASGSPTSAAGRAGRPSPWRVPIPTPR